MKNTFRLINLILILTILLSPGLTACSNLDQEAAEKPANYGKFGADFAINLAQTAPHRGPGSAGEQKAAELIKSACSQLGYQVQEQEFAFYLDNGQQARSKNLIIKIPGRGFKYESGYDPNQDQIESLEPPSQLTGRKLIILTHYDTFSQELPGLSQDQENSGLPNFGLADGLHDNAAGVGVLVSLAQQLKNQKPGYDLELVFLGAGHSGFAGAEALLQSMTDQDKALTDCVINLANIYAGDKIYAHAGQNSVVGNLEKSYPLRRKLYEVTDIYYNNLLLTNNNFAIYTNQSTKWVNHPGLAYPVLYREWSLTESNHTPFDRAGYPIVFFQSGQYDLKNTDQTFKESTDPYFNSSGGQISGTGFDSSQLLLLHFAPDSVKASSDSSEPAEEAIDLLTKNINNLAFVLLELSYKAPPNCELK